MNVDAGNYGERSEPATTRSEERRGARGAEPLAEDSGGGGRAGLRGLRNGPRSARTAALVIPIDLTGKRALVAGVADDGGFGFFIARKLAQAGASVCLGTWPPALGIFETLLRRGKLDESRRLDDGRLLEFEKIYPLDAAYDVIEDAPADVRESKRYSGRGDFSIQGVADAMTRDFGPKCVDIIVHSLANGPEVHKPLI